MLGDFSFKASSLQGTVPTQLGRLKKMTSLFDLSLCKLTGALPTELGNMLEMRDRFQMSRVSLRTRNVSLTSTTTQSTT